MRDTSYIRLSADSYHEVGPHAAASLIADAQVSFLHPGTGAVLQGPVASVVGGDGFSTYENTLAAGTQFKVLIHDPAGHFPDQYGPGVTDLNWAETLVRSVGDATILNYYVYGAGHTDGCQVDLYLSEIPPVGTLFELIDETGDFVYAKATTDDNEYDEMYTWTDAAGDPLFVGPNKVQPGAYIVRATTPDGAKTYYDVVGNPGGFIGGPDDPSGQPGTTDNLMVIDGVNHSATEFPEGDVGPGRVSANPAYGQIETEKVHQLTHVGFSAKTAFFFDNPPADPSFQDLMLAGLSPRQARTWLREDHSLDALIRGGFTKAQAVLIAEA